MGLGIEFLDIGIGYIQQGLGWVRGMIGTLAGYIPGIEQNLAVTILFLGLSLYAGNLIVNKFVTRPLSGSYVLWTLIISLSIFLNLMYM